MGVFEIWKIPSFRKYSEVDVFCTAFSTPRFDTNTLSIWQLPANLSHTYYNQATNKERDDSNHIDPAYSTTIHKSVSSMGCRTLSLCLYVFCHNSPHTFPYVLVLIIMLLSAGIHIYYVEMPIHLTGHTRVYKWNWIFLFFKVLASAFPELAFSMINYRFPV